MNVIHHVNLAGIDLNLLVVFDALMSEQHLTRAAEKIGLSQPATSNALSRLRKLFKDDLFIKTSKGMTPTPKAVALAEPIRQVLLQIQSALSNDEGFVPQTSNRVFKLGMDDYTELVFLPGLMRHIANIAPNVKIQIRSTNWQRVPKMLDADEIDLSLGYCPQWQTWHQRQLLFDERFVCVASENHPTIQENMTLEDYVFASHLLVSLREDMVGMVDEILEKQNLKRHIALSVPHFLVVPFVLANTHLIATLPERMARNSTDVMGLRILPLPFEMPGFSVSMLWHSKNNNDPGNTWLRTIVSQLISD